MKKSSLRPYYRSFFKSNIGNLIFGLIATISDSACMIAVAFLIQQLIDACTGNPNAMTFSQLLLLSIIVITLYLGFLQLERICISKFVPKAMSQYKQFLFTRIAAKNIAAFRQENTATYLSAISNDTQTIQMGVCNIFNGFNGVFCMIFAITLMLWYSPLMTLGVLAISIIFFLISIPTSRKLIEAEQELSDCNEGVTNRFKDFLIGFPVVKSFRAEKEMTDLFKRDVNKSAEADRKRRMADLTFLVTMDGGLAAVRVIILLFGVWMAISGKGLSAGMVVAFIQLLDNVMSPLQELPLQISDVRASISLIRKAASNLDKNRRDEGQDINPVLKNCIEIKNLSFSYEPDKPVISGLNYTFKAGKRYAIVGGSGSGKTSLLNLLMGGNTYEGTIKFDNRELHEISSASLYAMSALISQNVFLFNATILDNITMFRDFPKEDVERAVRLSGLSEVMTEKGEEFLCGENGCNLSGGEKQRVSIARCLLRKSSVLLVDEATSALDSETAYKVSKALLNLTDITEIVVTHKLDPRILAQYDAILAIKSGNIEEVGKFDELMERKGYFYSLYTVS